MAHRLLQQGWPIAVFLLAACGTREPLPPLPDIVTTTFLPAVGKAVQEAMADARAHPEDAAAVGRLGMVLHAHSQLVNAATCYRRAALLDRKNFEWQYYLGTVTEGAESVKALRAALRLGDYLPAKLRLGDALLAQGEDGPAQDVFRNIDHPAALFGYGRATGDAAYYEKAVRAFPQYGGAIFALARHYTRTGRNADARRLMAEYEKFKTVAPPVDDPLMNAVDALNNSPDRLLDRAARLEAQGQLGAAADLQLRALELDPDLAQVHVNLISLYGRLGETAKAEDHYRRAIALKPNAHEAHYNFGVLCYQSNRRAEAQAAFAKALSIHPDNADAHNNLGALLQEQGRIAEAARHFEKAIELRPDLRLARFHLGRIYVAQRRFAQAILQFRRIVTVDDEQTPTYLYALGATQARTGDDRAAIATLTGARQKALARGQASLAAAIDGDLGRLRR
jgi:tetratricopeptide (TPR) repeat protein